MSDWFQEVSEKEVSASGGLGVWGIPPDSKIPQDWGDLGG